MIAHAKPHAPLDVYATTVARDWIDYNGHMNDAAYALVFSRSVDALMDRIGLDAAARKRTGQSLVTLKMMLHYVREAREGEALAVACRLLEHDDKRMRVWLELFDEKGERRAASEQLLLSVALGDGARATPWTHETQAALDALRKLHASLPTPPEAGAGVAMKRG
ncbi:acyl-CoA thioester hydrolase [Roseiarcus fermentans]|uniref:Acyl-CoA thioester hydrolase n=1 Tax=Roseiarcus fermentans TaxID=1473586 RepID=A0A366F515_9HYPH|nr:thioesterase family protein [Roseiarcus fermentans]RBP09236.1 acyl-CoA thioester hydrolase [Roseiarcus fermentans]